MIAKPMLHLTIASLSLAAALPAMSAGDAKRGKDLYETSCSICHTNATTSSRT